MDQLYTSKDGKEYISRPAPYKMLSFRPGTAIFAVPTAVLDEEGHPLQYEAVISVEAQTEEAARTKLGRVLDRASAWPKSFPHKCGDGVVIQSMLMVL